MSFTQAMFMWVGVVIVGFVVCALLLIGYVCLISYCHNIANDVIRNYHRGKLHEKFTNKIGYDCARYLVRYNEHHGMNRWKYTTRDWENYFENNLRIGKE